MRKIIGWAVPFLAVAGVALAATTYSGRLLIRPVWSHAKTTALATVTETFDSLLSWDHTTGDAADQMETVVVREGTLTNGASITYDLLAIVNGFGDTISFDTVRFMAFSCTNDVIEVGDAASDAFVNWVGAAGDTIKIRPAGIALFVAPDATGYAVGTAGDLKIANTSTNTVGYTMYIGGSE